MLTAFLNALIAFIGSNVVLYLKYLSGAARR